MFCCQGNPLWLLFVVDVRTASTSMSCIGAITKGWLTPTESNTTWFRQGTPADRDSSMDNLDSMSSSENCSQFVLLKRVTI